MLSTGSSNETVLVLPILVGAGGTLRNRSLHRSANSVSSLGKQQHSPPWGHQVCNNDAADLITLPCPTTTCPAKNCMLSSGCISNVQVGMYLASHLAATTSIPPFMLHRTTSVYDLHRINREPCHASDSWYVYPATGVPTQQPNPKRCS